jgi:NAD(P)-dependent dehydrogenase (short-subunit alcohol dehydrogenase family)
VRKNSKNKFKNWLIVGGGSPISMEVAKSLSVGNCLITITYSNKDSMEECSKHFENQNGATYQHVVCDLENQHQLNDLIKLVSSQNEKLDGFIYLAATGGTRVPIKNLTDQQIRKIFDVNVIAAIIILKNLVDKLSKAQGSAIFVGSQAAVTGGRLLSAYAASKAALHQIVASVARELASLDIRVNCVSPGVIDTPKMRKSNNITTESELDTLANSIPSGRIGSPHEVATAIVWLLSSEASYISGATLPVSGGR